MVGVYKITNLFTNDFYIGQSIHIEERWTEHFCAGYGAIHGKLFKEAINQYGKSGFKFEVIEQCAKQDLEERERYWIEKLKPAYNVLTVGHEVSEETREKIRKSLAGRTQPRELVEKRKAALHARYKLIPKTNAEHKKRVAVQEDTVKEFDSVKALAAYMKVDPSTITHALKSGQKVSKKQVWYVV